MLDSPSQGMAMDGFWTMEHLNPCGLEERTCVLPQSVIDDIENPEACDKQISDEGG